jgi:hypothetical protein
MKEAMRIDLLNIITKAKSALSREDSASLSKFSTETITYASVYQDKESVQVAVIMYALAKIVQRAETDPSYWQKIHESIEKEFYDAEEFLEKSNDKGYYDAIKKILQDIGQADDMLRKYIEDVLGKAKIVKGFNMYDSGVSIGRSAELLGISQWELMSYAGKTKVIDIYKEGIIPIKERLAYAKKIFEVE